MDRVCSTGDDKSSSDEGAITSYLLLAFVLYLCVQHFVNILLFSFFHSAFFVFLTRFQFRKLAKNPQYL